MRASLLALTLTTIGACDATFVDLRELGPTVELSEADLDGEIVEVATGQWQGRAGYLGAGSVTLLQFESGARVLSFGPDFQTSDVPGPVVVLSRRNALGTELDFGAGDLELGTLGAISGAQEYLVPEDYTDQLVAWVFCRPFGVEIARARMEAL